MSKGKYSRLERKFLLIRKSFLFSWQVKLFLFIGNFLLSLQIPDYQQAFSERVPNLYNMTNLFITFDRLNRFSRILVLKVIVWVSILHHWKFKNTVKNINHMMTLRLNSMRLAFGERSIKAHKIYKHKNLISAWRGVKTRNVTSLIKQFCALLLTFRQKPVLPTVKNFWWLKVVKISKWNFSWKTKRIFLHRFRFQGRILNSFKMFKSSKYELRTIKWSSMAPKSTKGEKSLTWVKCLIRRKWNLEILMIIYGFLESYWLVLMGPCEKLMKKNLFQFFGSK